MVSFLVGTDSFQYHTMKQSLTQEQYEADFKQVVLYNSVYSIDRYFDGNVHSFLQTTLKFSQVRLHYLDSGEKISDIEFHDLLQKIEKLNYAFGLPKDFVKAMFHRRDGKQTVSEFIDRLCESGEIVRWNHGVLKTKTATKHFTAKYLPNMELLASIFKDKALLAKVLDCKSDFYTKRQYRFISKLKNIKQQKENTMIHNDEEPVFINQQQAYSRRRMTKAQREKLNEDIPEKDVEDTDPTGSFTCFSEEKKREFMEPVQYSMPVDYDKQRELDRLMYPFRKRVFDKANPISEEELKMKEQEFRKELGLEV